MNIKIKAILVSIIAIVFLGSSSLAFAAPYDLLVTHEDGTGTTTVTDALTPSLTDGAYSIPYFLGSGGTSGTYHLLNVGSGIGATSGTLYVTPATIQTTDGHLSDTLTNIENNAATIQGEVGALGSQFNMNYFMLNPASTTPYIASSTFNGFMSATQAAQLAALATPGMGNVTLALNTARQPSTTTPTFVTTSTDVTTTLSLSGGTSGKVTFQEATSSAFTSPITVGEYTNSNTGTLTVGLNTSQIGTANLSAVVPAGYWYRLVTTNLTGTPTYSSPLVTESAAI